MQAIAAKYPQDFVIGIDACRENLVKVSRSASANSLFVIANAQDLPSELKGLASRVSINFPWGSLLEGLVQNDAAMLQSLLMLMPTKAELEIRLNASALAQAGFSLEDGAILVRESLRENGFRVSPSSMMLAEDLAIYPTTWAKRLAYGREPHAILLKAIR